MPYKLKGKVIYVKKGGKWRVKAREKSIDAAKSQFALLRELEHGWTPRR